MKKSLSFFAAALSVLLLASCGEAASQQIADTTAPSAAADNIIEEAAETEAAYPDGVGEHDFGGYNFRIASCYFFDHELATYLVFDELTGNPVNDELYNAKMYIENRFNVNISWIACGDTTDVNNYVMKAVSAGDDAFDITIGHDGNTGTLAKNGYLYDMYKIDEFNFDQPWWPKDAVDNLTVCGKMYAASNYMSYCGLHWTRALIINKDIAENYNKTIPYDLVRDGTWTVDRLFDLIADTAADLDGNGKINKNDQLSYITGVETGYCLQESFDCGTYIKDDKGVPSLTIDQNRLQTMVEKMHRLIKETEGYLSDGSFGVDVFRQGNSFVSNSQIGDAYDTYRNADFAYGFLPVPKLDENQQNYINCCTDVPWAIPKSSEALDVIGSVCEALSCYNYTNVLPAYFETAIKTRLSDSPDDAEMLQLIADTRTIGFAYFYSMPFKNIVNDVANKKSPDLASYLAKNTSAAEKAITELVEAFENME